MEMFFIDVRIFYLNIRRKICMIQRKYYKKMGELMK